MQIRTRLTFWFIGITALLLLSSLLFIYYNFYTHIRSEYFKSLQSKALMTVAMLVKNNPELDYKHENTTEENFALPSKENIVIYNNNLEKLFSFNEESDIKPEILTYIKQHGNYTFKINQYDAIGIRYTTNFGKELIIIAKGMLSSEDLASLKRILYITFFLFVTFTALGGFYFAGKALHPITKTMNEIDHILPSDLSKRLQVDKNNDELSRLSQTFNKLLDRIEESFNIQKGFLSNVSHELRNPLTSIISTLKITLSKKRGEEEYLQCLNSVLDDTTGLQQTSNQLMELARISSTSNRILFDRIRFDEVVWDAISNLKKTNPSYDFKLDTSSMPENQDQLLINANESLIKTALINLFENACKFSPDHCANIRVYSETENQVAIDIQDTATIIPKEEKQNLFKPFYRSAETKKIKGFGIGLSLVATILKIHEANLTISNNGNIGNIFTIKFLKAA